MPRPKQPDIVAELPRVTTQPDGTRWLAYLDRKGAVRRERIHPVQCPPMQAEKEYEFW